MAEVSIGAIQRIFNNLINIVNQTLDGYIIGSITPAAGTFTTIAGIFTGSTQDAINKGVVTNPAALTLASTTTVANITGLSVALTAAGTYAVEGAFPLTNVTAGGAKITLHGVGGLTLTSANLTGLTYSGASIVADQNITALDADFVAFANTSTLATLQGTLIVLAGGTLQVQAAQHTSNATSSTVQAGSYLKVTRIA